MSEVSSGVSIPPPMPSHGNAKKEYEGVLREAVRRVVMPIFEAELHRKRKNDTPDSMGILWRPNNYRRKAGYVDDKSISDTTLVSCARGYQEAVKTSKSVVFVEDYPGIQLMIGRRSVTGIWKQERIGRAKAVYCLSAPTLDALQGLLEAKKEEIRSRIDLAILDFMDRFGLSGSPVWERSEDWIRDTGYQVPIGAIVYLDGAKKVYDEGLEFTSKSGEEPLVGLQRFIEARSIEKVSPQIAAELAELRRVIARQNEILSKAQILVPEKVAPKTGQKRLTGWSS